MTKAEVKTELLVGLKKLGVGTTKIESFLLDLEKDFQCKSKSKSKDVTTVGDLYRDLNKKKINKDLLNKILNLKMRNAEEVWREKKRTRDKMKTLIKMDSGRRSVKTSQVLERLKDNSMRLACRL